MFLLPPLASVILFVFLWRADLLLRSHADGGCFLVGVAVQLLAPVYSLAWFAAGPVERRRRDLPVDPSEACL